MADDGEPHRQRRRLQNRDRMRRLRERQVQGVTGMRATLGQLTQQFQGLISLTASNPQLLQQYQESTNSSKRLQRERLQLQRCINDWHKVRAKLVVELAHHPQMSVPIPTRQLQDATRARPLRFHDLSESGIHQVIRRCAVNLQLREQQLSASDIFSVRPASANMNFGWSIVCDLSDASDVFVSMTKRLPGVTAHQAMMSTWDTLDNPALYPHRTPLRNTVVQVIPERAFVEVRDIPTYGHLREKRQRSCMMAFQIDTERGYGIGMGSIAPDQCPKDGRIGDFVEHSSWTELADDIDGCCVATVSYRGQYDSGDTPHRRLVNLLSAIRSWEDLVMDRPLQIMN